VYVCEDGLVIDGRPPEAAPMPLLLYLDQNYLSGLIKRKPAFRELDPALRAAVARGAVAVPEAEALTCGRSLPRCRLATCDAFMADVVRRSGLHVRFRCEFCTGRRRDVDRLRQRLEHL
jgi:hypothetical protein